MRIVIAKKAFNRKISLLTSKLNIELKKLGVMFGTLLYMALKKLERKYLGALKCGAGGEWRR